MSSVIALVPARAGSQRVRLKNVRRLGPHPLIAYTLASALASKLFDRVLVSTDSPEIAEIARHYGADVPFLRPPEFATHTSPDIEWLRHAFESISERHDAFAILRPTSPFRSAATLERAARRFFSLEGVDSLRAVELVKQHPGKMWVIEGDVMRPLLDQSHLEVAWHARQYQDLPKVYIQNSSLEMAWTRVVRETHSREGRVVAPFLTQGVEGFAIDYEEDWMLAERWLALGQASLPAVDQPPFEES